jgi:hypothetical protein
MEGMSLRDRLFGRNSGAPAAGTPTPAAQEVTDGDLLVAAREAVLPGFTTHDDAVQRVREFFELEDDDPRPAAIVGDVWARREAEESTWATPSDYDRLAAAFADLHEQGVVARMDFTCCNTCGTAEIDKERTPIDGAEGYAFRESAYTFFHRQDTERLAEMPTRLYLTYSAWRPAPDTDPELLAAARAGDTDALSAVVAHTDARVGRLVSAALRAHGLTVDWSGDHRERIAIAISDWRKPLPA